jgi:formate-dependent nitrite reductase membrane component NrfD
MTGSNGGSGRGSYYGRPILKAPVWKPYIAAYFYTGGLAGASSLLGVAARVTGNRRLARNASLIAAAGVAASPPLLILDLGRPMRFLNMLRLLKPTSPMSVGTWVLSASGAADTLAAACNLLRVAPRLGRAAEGASALLAPALCTYTAVLLSDTAVPVWHEARRELPFVFGAGAAASAGAAAALVTPARDAGPARHLAALGAVGELAAFASMERRLGELAAPYRQGTAGRYARAAKALTAAGAALTLTAGRRRARQARLGAGILTAASLCTRFAVLAAGTQSAQDPRFTVEPQRRRAAERERREAAAPAVSHGP